MAEGRERQAARPRKTRRAPKTPTTADPVEIAMEAVGEDPAPDNPARQLLIDQNRLIRAQTSLAANERFRARILVLRDCALTAGAVLLLALLAWTMWSASRSTALVIQPFRAPTDLAAQGIDGTMIAGQVLDHLQTKQRQTPIPVPANATQGNWGDDLRIEIPGAGISFDDAEHWLRRRLGHETVVAGDVWRPAPGQLTLTVRTAKGAATFTGADGDLDRLADQAADAVYGQTQPLRFAWYLYDHDRLPEALKVIESHALTGPLDERPRAFANWGVMVSQSGDEARGLALIQNALLLDDRVATVWRLQAAVLFPRGRWEEALAANQRFLDLVRFGGRREAVLPEGMAVWKHQARWMIGEAKGDYRAVAAALAEDSHDTVYNTAVVARRRQARFLALAHDLGEARRLNGGVASGAGVLSQAATSDGVLRRAQADLAIHSQLDDWPAALSDLEQVEQAFGPIRLRMPGVRRSVDVDRTIILAQLGRHAEAKAVGATLASDCYPCLVARGRAATLAGDAAAADRLFAEAARQGPSLPHAFNAWGRAKLARGDADGAIALFQTAQAKGPRWADPPHYRGEALLAKGDARRAVDAFKTADRMAPQWGRNHLLWGEALARLGKAGQARRQFELARGLDLSTADRARVDRALAGA